MAKTPERRAEAEQATPSGAPAVLVIGDAMLDHYVCGRAARLSPEAPVPVLLVEREYNRLGGAANVASNLARLGARTTLLTLVGRDDAGNALLRLAQEAGIRVVNLADSEPSSRPTTEKVRILSPGRRDLGLGRHQFLRVDFEETIEIDESLRARVLAEAKKLLPDVAAVVLSDYRKGMLPAPLVQSLVKASREAGKLILADFKNPDGSAYRGCDCVCVNEQEAAALLGRREASPARAAQKLVTRLHAKVVVKAAERGVYAASGKQPFSVRASGFAARSTEGAGDVFLAALTVGLVRGKAFRKAVHGANAAVEKALRHEAIATGEAQPPSEAK